LLSVSALVCSRNVFLLEIDRIMCEEQRIMLPIEQVTNFILMQRIWDDIPSSNMRSPHVYVKCKISNV